MKTRAQRFVMAISAGLLAACGGQTASTVADLDVPEPPIEEAASAQATDTSADMEVIEEAAEEDVVIEAIETEIPEPSAAPVTMVGTWGKTLEQCGNFQEVMDAPMILTMEGYDQHEAHCSFDLVVQLAPNSWKVDGSCSVDGYEEPMEMIYTVVDDKLIPSIDDYEWPPLLRCP
ncbi:MAG: hypothetical protein AAF768_06190 [Pseudomonadota bacterium]